MTTEAASISFEPKTVEELRCFFEVNRDKYKEVWVVLTKKDRANLQPVSFVEAVAEAVKQGLIDSRTKSLTTEKYAIRFTKRKIQRRH